MPSPLYAAPPIGATAPSPPAEGKARARRLLAAFARAVRGTPWRALLVGGGVTLVLAVLLPAGVLAWHLRLDRRALPDLTPFERFELPVIGQIRDARGVPLAELAHERRRMVAYEEIPPIVRAAILAAEDNRFLSHAGVDLLALPRVAVRTLVHVLRREEDDHELFVEGGSTLTQQLVRGFFLQEQVRAERGPTLSGAPAGERMLGNLLGPRAANKLLRKVEEVRLSLWLERELEARRGSKLQAKRAILVRYANLAYLGDGRYGFAEGAGHWFGRPLESLTTNDAPQAAFLAARLRRPGETDPDALLRRRNQVLARMAANGAFPADDLRWFQQAPLQLEPVADEELPSVPGVVRGVIGELKQRGVALETLMDGQVQVRSTIDARIQRLASEALEGGIAAYARRHRDGAGGLRGAGALQGAVVVLANGDAAVLAEVGGRPAAPGRPVRSTDFDRVTEALRQPGSVMKPFVYLAALRHGYRLDSEVDDSPIAVPAGAGQPVKWIANYDARFLGHLPLRRALALSRNAATVAIAQRIGMRAVLQTARELGIETELAAWPSTALGASEVTLLELANAYRAMASGLSARPHFLLEVTGLPGVQLPSAAEVSGPLAIDPVPLAMIQEGLRGVVRLPGGTARALDAPSFGVPVMGKTGTTSECRDALFVGSTFGPRGITVAVWIGFDDASPLGGKESGAKAALPVFRQLVGEVYQQGLLGPAPRFPSALEHGIDAFLLPPPPAPEEVALAQTLVTPSAESSSNPADLVAPDGAAATPESAPAQVTRASRSNH